MPRPVHDTPAHNGRPWQATSRRATGEPRPRPGFPALRIGVASGLVAIGCCAGPTVLALAGVVGAANAYVWANRLYDGYAWWFRAAGAALAVAATVVVLRRQDRCSLAGLRQVRARLAVLAGAAAGTYAVLSVLTTGLGRLAT